MIPLKLSLIGFTAAVMLTGAAGAAILQQQGGYCNHDQVIPEGQIAPAMIILPNDSLARHNTLRAKHGAPPLTWNTTLEEFALARDKS